MVMWDPEIMYTDLFHQLFSSRLYLFLAHDLFVEEPIADEQMLELTEY
jgi:hypothetical protein